jgi:hypothetical protein
MKKSDARSESPSKLDDSGVFASPYPTYAVFERESREFQSFHFFILQLLEHRYKTSFNNDDTKIEDAMEEEEEEVVAMDEDDLDDMNDLITSALSDAKRYGMDDEEDQDDELGTNSDVYTSALSSKQSPEGSRNRHLVKSIVGAIGGDSSTSPRPPPPPPVQTTTTTTTTTTPKSNSTKKTTKSKERRGSDLENRALADARVSALPPGSIRREGNYWVAYYRTIHNDVEHYVGRFRTEVEALNAYEKRAEYYSHRDLQGDKRREFFKKYDVSSPRGGERNDGDGSAPPGIDILLDPIPHDLVPRTDFLINKMQAETYARGGRNIDNFLVHLTAPHKREAARREQALPVRDFINTTKRLSYLTQEQALRLSKCLQPGDSGLISFENLRVFVAGKWPNAVAPKTDDGKKRSTYVVVFECGWSSRMLLVSLIYATLEDQHSKTRPTLKLQQVRSTRKTRCRLHVAHQRPSRAQISHQSCFQNRRW